MTTLIYSYIVLGALLLALIILYLGTVVWETETKLSNTFYKYAIASITVLAVAVIIASMIYLLTWLSYT